MNGITAVGSPLKRFSLARPNDAFCFVEHTSAKRQKNKIPNFQASTAPINRARLETKSHIVPFWSLISARSASQWIEADPILWPTQHGIQRTAGVMASLWHNQKKKENTQKANLFWVIYLFLFSATTPRCMCHFADSNKMNTFRRNKFSALKDFLRQLQ